MAKNKKPVKNQKSQKQAGKSKIEVTKDGPYLVYGSLPLAKEIVVNDNKGDPLKWKKGKNFPREETYSLCRCGHSSNKPFCDSTHITIKFDGTETASRKKYMQQLTKKVKGDDGITLLDAENFCAGAEFCQRLGGTWNLTKVSSNLKAKKVAVQQACDCPSGRLVMIDNRTKKSIEPKFTPSISITEDPDKGMSGPIWVKGYVPVESSDGKGYELRNRVTLCRCGYSTNKPFCDGTHISAEFNDEAKEDIGKLAKEKKRYAKHIHKR